MSHILTIHAGSRTLRRALEKLLLLGDYAFETKPETLSSVVEPTWETLTADDYRAMIRQQSPELKAKSLREYEG